MTEHKHSLKFLSYNLYCLPWIATAFSPASCPLSSERSTAFLEHVPSYDVLALQEVWDPRYKTLERFAAQNNIHVVGSSAPAPTSYFSLRLFGGGLMIMSKHPIVDTREVMFDQGSHSDKFVTKGVLYAKIKVGSSFVHIFNTHLQASYGYEFDFNNNPFTAIRHRQLKKLAEFVKQVTSNDNYPIMLAGDFNVNARAAPDDGSDSREYQEMLEILQSSSYQVFDILKEHNGGKHPETYGGIGVLHGEKPKVGGQRLDFILELKRDSPHKYKFLEGQVVPFKVMKEMFTHISDHYAQSVVLEMHVNEDVVDGANTSNLAEATISLGTA